MCESPAPFGLRVAEQRIRVHLQRTMYTTNEHVVYAYGSRVFMCTLFEQRITSTRQRRQHDTMKTCGFYCVCSIFSSIGANFDVYETDLYSRTLFWVHSNELHTHSTYISIQPATY